MDIFIHWWAFRRLRTEFNANMIIVMEAIKLDIVLLVKVSTDTMVIYAAFIRIIAIFIGERLFLQWQKNSET